MVNSRGRITFTVPSVAEVLQAHTKGTRGRTSSQLQPWMRRRVPAHAVACASTVLKVILPEMHSKKRWLERKSAIDGPVRRDAGPIDRLLSGAERDVRGVDDDVVTARIGGHHRRGQCRVTEVVREECTPRL